MRTVYLGTSAFAAAVLLRLAESPHRPSLVISRPDAPRGRGRRLAAPPVIETADALGIDTLQPDSVNDDQVVGTILATAPEALVVCAFGAIIRDPLLGAAEIFNVHPSLLPRWRGAAPIERAIMAGDEQTGVCIMRLTAGLDSGPVCARTEVPIGPEDDYDAVSDRLQTVSGELLVAALTDRPAFAEQAEAGVTYAEKITGDDRRLRPGEETAAALHDRIRALSPHIGAFLELPGDERLGVLASRVAADRPGPEAGSVEWGGSRLLVGCRDGALELLTVVPPGRRAMAAADYLRGRRS